MAWVMCGRKGVKEVNNSVLAIIVSLLISLITIVSCKVYVNSVFKRISHMIQSFISKRTIDDSDVADTFESKLVNQLKQLIRIVDFEAKSSMEEKEAVKSLISDISHQLKTPLANITMYTEILQDDTLTQSEKSEFIIRTKEQANKMEWLLSALLKMSRLETGIIEFDMKPTLIKETIMISVRGVRNLAEQKNIHIKIEEFQDKTLLHNRKWTAEAILNILENAIKYSKEYSSILIKVIPMELFTKIQIIDQGIGISSDELNAIFQRFYRSKQVEQKEGTGLGLYLSQLILSKQGGYITVESKVLEGSCFSIFLQNVNDNNLIDG
jgi:signal transduction histidine kinase